MSNEDNTVWLTCNGEIYNYKRIRAQLVTLGHRFSSQSDSEVLVHGYEQWGIEGLLERIKGMFAFALLDLASKKLYLARDRFGIKPVYYLCTDDFLAFSSELKGIVTSRRVNASIDPDSLADYLLYRFIPAPKSIYHDILKLKPAEFLQLEIDSWKMSTKAYWEVVYGFDVLSEEAVSSEVTAHLNRTVSDHFVSDVPVGILLSGGYDSSTLLHISTEQGYEANTYSIGFEDWQSSEHEAARTVAEKYGSRHNEKVLSCDLVDETERLTYFFDEPLGGSSFLPTYFVSNLASRDVKVVLGGDGGDELFAGYSWYKLVLSRGLVLKRKLRDFLNMSDSLFLDYAKFTTWSDFTPREVEHLRFHTVEGDRSELRCVELYDRYNSRGTELKRLQFLDFNTFLPEVVLTKVDRASMANSLEVRVPYLDHEFVSFVMSLNERCYYRPDEQKFLLRRLLEKRLPRPILDKPKQGFGAPMQRIFSLDVARKRLIGGQVVRHGVFDNEHIRRFFEQRQRRKLWALYILELWLAQWAPV